MAKQFHSYLPSVTAVAFAVRAAYIFRSVVGIMMSLFVFMVANMFEMAGDMTQKLKVSSKSRMVWGFKNV